MSTLFTPLLDALSLASPLVDDERPTKRLKNQPIFAHLVMGCCLGDHGFDARAASDELRRGVLTSMFEAAADEKAGGTNRRKIYKLWREEADDE